MTNSLLELRKKTHPSNLCDYEVGSITDFKGTIFGYDVLPPYVNK